MQHESYLVRQERCPECAKLGRDNSADNLSTYSDGHSYCFGCGWHIPASKIGIWIAKNKEDVQAETHEVYLPSDCTTNYPSVCLSWMAMYELDKTVMLNNNCLWSEYKQRLIFPVYGPEGLLAYQGRYFGEDITQKKWDSRGDLKNIFHILGKGSSLVLVEDIVSAIKISKITRAMPIFGSSIGVERFKRIRMLCKEGEAVYIWLDPDMRAKSVIEVRRGILCGLNTHAIFSDRDPKEETYETIREKV